MRRLAPLFVVAFSVCLLHPIRCDGQESADSAAHTAGSMAGAKLFSRAADLQNKQDWDAAISTWRAFLRTYPDDPLTRQAHNYLGVCLLQKESFQSAATEFEQVLDDQRKGEIAEEAHLNLAWCYYSQGFNNDPKKLRKAAHIFKSHTTRYPQSPMHDQALFYLAESLIMTDLPKQAIEAYEELIEECPDSPLRADALYALGNALTDRKELEQAQEAYDTLAGEYPNHAMADEANLRRAEALMSAGDWKAAAEKFARLADKGGDETDYVTLRMGLCLERLERFADAATVYSTVVVDHPDSEFAPDATLGAARAFALAHDTENAKKWLAQVEIGEADTAMEVAHWKCRLHLLAGHPKQAVATATAALRAHPKAAFHIEVALDQAEAMSLIPSSRQDASKKYLEIAKLLPDGELQWRAMLGAADCLLQLKRTSQAAALANDFLKKHDQHEHRPAFAYILAESYRIEGDRERAQKLLAALLKDKPEHQLAATWRRRMARILLQEEQYEDALAVLDDVDEEAATEEEKSEAFFFRAIALDKLSRTDEAIKAYREAYEVQPKGRWADKCLLAIADLQNDLGKSAAAESTIKLARSRPMEADADLRAKLQLAEAALNAGDHEKATKIFTALGSEASTDDGKLLPHALFGQAYAQLYERAFARSNQLFTEFLQTYPSHMLTNHAHYGRALVQGYQTHYAEGIEDLDVVLAAQPRVEFAANAVYLKGLYQHHLGKYELATETFKSLLQEQPDYGRKETVLYQLALAAAKRDDTTAAVKWIAQLSSEFPDSKLPADALASTAERSFDKRRYDVAERLYQEALELGPKTELQQTALYKLGWSQFRQQKYDAALQSFRDTAETKIHGQRLNDVRFMQAECLFKLRKFAEAAALYDIVNEFDTLDPATRLAVLHHGAICLQEVREWNASAKWLQKLLVEKPEPALRTKALLLLGKAYDKTDATALAHQHYSAATGSQVAATKAEAHVRLGQLLVDQTENLKALREFQQVMFGFDKPTDENLRGWVALSAIEAGRCSLRLSQAVKDTRESAEHRRRAEEYFRSVIRDYADLKIARVAGKLLDAM